MPSRLSERMARRRAVSFTIALDSNVRSSWAMAKADGVR